MGVSTDAILFFGIDLGENNEFPWIDEEDGADVESFIAAKLGVSRPDCEYEGNEKLFSDYWNKRREVMRNLGCDVGWHCSGSYPMCFVCLEKFNFSACRGYPQIIDPAVMQTVSAEDIQKLKDFCELIEVEWQEPKWQLASYWGE